MPLSVHKYSGEKLSRRLQLEWCLILYLKKQGRRQWGFLQLDSYHIEYQAPTRDITSITRSSGAGDLPRRQLEANCSRPEKRFQITVCELKIKIDSALWEDFKSVKTISMWILPCEEMSNGGLWKQCQDKSYYGEIDWKRWDGKIDMKQWLGNN